VNGTTITIARIKGRVYAFQEFCTHRYGPLSEGAFEGNEVICPWHCSKFDVRTGKVTAGPAKVDLRTFGVEERDGKIWIEPPSA
jgi:nitrite reductase/ring-hydroxylating ferredoxin subunit